MRSVLSPYRRENPRAKDTAKDDAPPVSWLYVWGPAILAVAVIAIESTRTFSADNTSGWLRPFAEALLGRLSEARWAHLHHLIRKSGHFAGFGGVCVTFVRAWLWRTINLVPKGVARWRIWASGLGIASTAVIASLDEWHQTFLPNRTGKLSDVLLDTCGGIVACLALWALFWWRDADYATPKSSVA